MTSLGYLASRQQAAVAVDMMPLLEAEGKERKSALHSKSLSQKVDQADKGKVSKKLLTLRPRRN